MHEAFQAGLLGLLSASSLLVGALVGLFTPVSQRASSVLMAFGAGALIAAASFELVEKANRTAGLGAVALGLAVGALVFFVGDLWIAQLGGAQRKRSRATSLSGASLALALGALLDGVPESLAIGAGYSSGGGFGWAMVGAVFLSNIPESLASAAGLRRSGFAPGPVMGLWTAITLVSGVSALLGHTLVAGAAGPVVATSQAFAAGAILAMLASTMMPEAYEHGGPVVGLATALGFLAAIMLERV
ncbi:MAG: ZIP family metal transporter [Candidatus Sericytochromatia bacterium]